MVYRAAILWDQKKNFSREAAMAKLYASEIANEVSRECVQIMGYEGCTTDYLVESMMRDAKITEIYEGTNEIQRLVIAASWASKHKGRERNERISADRRPGNDSGSGP